MNGLINEKIVDFDNLRVNDYNILVSDLCHQKPIAGKKAQKIYYKC